MLVSVLLRHTWVKGYLAGSQQEPVSPRIFSPRSDPAVSAPALTQCRTMPARRAFLSEERVERLGEAVTLVTHVTAAEQQRRSDVLDESNGNVTARPAVHTSSGSRQPGMPVQSGTMTPAAVRQVTIWPRQVTTWSR